MSQELDIAAFYGRFWSPYKFKDYANGYRNQASSNFNFFPSLTINKYYKEKISAELGAFLTIYEQYYSTRKYTPAFESSFVAGNITLRGCYSLLKNKMLEFRIKGGIGLGITGLYEASYVEMFVYPFVDSITRGTIKRNFTPVFPMLSTGFDISYKIAKRFKISIAANYQKGFIKITEYDIYYNDGSGNNDQHAKQWGTGDFYGVQLGLRYLLKDGYGMRKEK